MRKYIYPGAIHIHTLYSDGTASMPEIAKWAKKAGLAWIIVTDHNNLKGFKNNEEGWYDGVAVLIGEEISPKTGNHYLALNIKEEISQKTRPEEYIEKVKAQGGIGFIAHPDESLGRANKYRALRWDNWDITGFNGLEIWNFLADWVDNYNPKNPAKSYFFRHQSLNGPTQKVLQWWDKLNNNTKEIVPAIGGADAHALKYKFLGITLKIFPYLVSFNAVINNIIMDNELSKDFNEAKQQIYTAIEKGNNLIENRKWRHSKHNIEFYIQNQDSIAYSGDSVKIENNSKLVIKTPKKAKIKLIYDGNFVYEIFGKELVYTNLSPGKYRAEIYHKNHPWAFTNPISIL